MSDVTVVHGDCLAVMRELPGESVDSIVTDPPYGLGLMGKAWDALPPGKEWAEECLRVLKPGGHMLAFGGTRTWHRLAVAIEDAGFEIRDSIAWMYGSGFPKSMNVAAAVEKHRAEKQRADLLPDEEAFCQWMRDHSGLTAADARRLFGSDRFITGEVQIVNTATADNPRMSRRAMVPTFAAWQKARTALATEPPDWVESLVKSPPQPTAGTPGEVWTPGKGRGTAGDNEWAGWGTALKPAFEPVVVARKPIQGTVAANVLKYGTGALNIDASRIGYQSEADKASAVPQGQATSRSGSLAGKAQAWQSPSETASSTTAETTVTSASQSRKSAPTATGMGRTAFTPKQNDSGRFPANVILDESQAAALDKQLTVSVGSGKATGPSRFFYVAKASKRERPVVDGVAHPTVKPVALMRYLVRLVTPPSGVVLDPFAGSGSTLEAAALEGFKVIGIEREPDYLPLIDARLERVKKQAA